MKKKKMRVRGMLPVVEVRNEQGNSGFKHIPCRDARTNSLVNGKVNMKNHWARKIAEESKQHSTRYEKSKVAQCMQGYVIELEMSRK
jgi:hypothetical protein